MMSILVIGEGSLPQITLILNKKGGMRERAIDNYVTYRTAKTIEL